MIKLKNLSSQRAKGFFRGTTSIRRFSPARSCRTIIRSRCNGRTRAVLLARWAFFSTTLRRLHPCLTCGRSQPV